MDCERDALQMSLFAFLYYAYSYSFTNKNYLPSSQEIEHDWQALYLIIICMF